MLRTALPQLAHAGHATVHAGKWSLVPLEVDDGVQLRIVPSSGSNADCSGDALELITATGGRLAINAPPAGKYLVCQNSKTRRRPLLHLRSLDLAAPSFSCSDYFGPLCPKLGTGALSPQDIAFAIRRKLRVYLYTNVPPQFHWRRFLTEQPEDVRSGKICDFVSGPCTPNGMHYPSPIVA